MRPDAGGKNLEALVHNHGAAGDGQFFTPAMSPDDKAFR